MTGWFRRRPRPVEQPPLPEHWADRGYAHANGYTLTQWADLTPQQRADLRDKVAHNIRKDNAA